MNYFSSKVDKLVAALPNPEEVVNHFNRYALWNSNQHGYGETRSTMTTLLQITDSMFIAADEREIANLLMIDESVVFDSINTDLLLKKLTLYGMDDSTVKWFRLYLNNRMQYVHLAGQCSTMKSVKCGVPQGSVLGPVLFTIFMNKPKTTFV